MPEPPDFEQLARRHAIERLSVDAEAAVELEQAFRDVWNARGAADREESAAHLAINGGESFPDGVRRLIAEWKADRMRAADALHSIAALLGMCAPSPHPAAAASDPPATDSGKLPTRV